MRASKFVAATFAASAGVQAFTPKPQPSHAGKPDTGGQTALQARQNSVGWGDDPKLQKLGASTTAPLDPSALKKGKGAESTKLSLVSPQEAFGFRQETVFSGNSGSSSSFNTALKRSAEKNGLAMISTKDWSAAEHFKSLTDFGGQDYVARVAGTPQDRFTGQGDGIAEMYDDGKPTITQAIMTHVFEGAGKDYQGNVVVLNKDGAPLNTKVFASLHNDAAEAVKADGVNSPKAKAAISALQAYVDEGGLAASPAAIKAALVGKSVLFEGWAALKNEGYQDNLDQAMLTIAHHFSKIQPGEALVAIFECPKAYGNTAHMLTMIFEKTDAESPPKVHIAHHESAEQYPGEDAEWQDGKMQRIAGVPLDTDASQAAYGDGMAPKSRNRLPVANSLKFGGPPHMNIVVSKNPGAIIERQGTEVLEAAQDPKPYSPRDTDGNVGSANTCISYTARLLAHEDSKLFTTDGKPIDVSNITSRSAPEVVREMGEAGLIAAGPMVSSPFIITPAGVFQNREPDPRQDAALDGPAGLEQFSAIGAHWGAGQFTPGMDTPAKPPLPHHIGEYIAREALKDLN